MAEANDKYMRLINSRHAMTIPISIATTRSKTTVKMNVTINTMISLFGAVFNICTKVLH